MRSTIGPEARREDDLAPRLPSRSQARPAAVVHPDATAPVESTEPRSSSLRRAYERIQALRRWRRERQRWSSTRKALLSTAVVGGLAVGAVELIQHGHRELGEDFAVGAMLLLLLLICVVGVRHFVAQELER